MTVGLLPTRNLNELVMKHCRNAILVIERKGLQDIATFREKQDIVLEVLIAVEKTQIRKTRREL